MRYAPPPGRAPPRPVLPPFNNGEYTLVNIDDSPFLHNHIYHKPIVILICVNCGSAVSHNDQNLENVYMVILE